MRCRGPTARFSIIRMRGALPAPAKREKKRRIAKNTATIAANTARKLRPNISQLDNPICAPEFIRQLNLA